MQFAAPTQARQTSSACPPPADLGQPLDVTRKDVDLMVLYLRKARDRARDIRDRSPAGSYMESVLSRTIDGLTLELSQLEYLLARKPADAPGNPPAGTRMRPAI
ncbi:hypothetical protein E1180_16430 [Roseibium denhamense]|uniref:Uncharacterized protein n=1 Tax=Roseibium denhamense TaxID=76305 RepID=A0ABY1P669_9HYPH|nr:hypothetical protein [Roseibium denhamense]MTI07097.1 hypothetical protein [Roseibium denhamense]SMP27149.1 hypothetical protein SAMN06265374_2863 [Roseibium denhamense]